SDPSVWALFSMREEYVASLKPYVYAIPTRFRTTFRLNLLNEAGAKLAIQKPAQEAGVTVDDEAPTLLFEELCRTRVLRLGERNIQEVEGPYVEPVHLQIVCQRLWANLPEDQDKITRADLPAPRDAKNLGFVDGVLADYYKERVKAIAE